MTDPTKDNHWPDPAPYMESLLDPNDPEDDYDDIPPPIQELPSGKIADDKPPPYWGEKPIG